MTETTALLRSLHCDLVATNGILAALLYNGSKTGTPYEEAINLAIQHASVYYGLADELAKEEDE
jgi:hypothetical protein